MAQKYTDEQKTAVLARVSEIGILDAAAEAGIPWKKVAKWYKRAAIAPADEIISAAQDLQDENDTETAEAVLAETPAEPKDKEKADKASRKAKKLKKAEKAIAEKPFKKARLEKMDLIFESTNGMQISLKALVEKIPKGCDAAYVKTEENKIYWVKGEEAGSEDIW